MCGILGIYKFDHDINEEKFKESLSLLFHRGPDNQAYIIKDKICFGHTRLSIIDTSNSANQPMICSETKNILIFNGEFYNYKEVKEELIKIGITFTTNSDSEVFLKAYNHWGTDFLKKVNGFFGAAIYDSKLDQLFIFRDRFGIKPIYYFKNEQYLIFSSEIKPILHYTSFKDLNYDVLSYYFNYRYNLSEHTLFKNITKLHHGSLIKVSSNDFSISKYWDPKDYIKSKQATTINELTKSFHNSVNHRLIADVPLGVFLSAGVDSNAIAQFAVKDKPDIKSYSIGFNSEVDESKDIKKFSNIHGISNNSYIVKDSDFNGFEKPIYFLEEPIGDSIILPTFKLTELTAKECKSTLSGEGADEILNGYIHHVSLIKEEYILNFIPKIFHPLISFFAGLIPNVFFEKFFPYPSKLGKSGSRKIVNHFKFLTKPAKRMRSLIELFFGEEFKKYFDVKIIIKDKDQLIENFFKANKDLSYVDIMTYQDLTFWNPNYTLHRLDRLSMANSLESRVPFLDHIFAEKILSLPQSDKTQWNHSKIALREILRSINAEKEIFQRKKSPFYFPINRNNNATLTQIIRREVTKERLDQIGIFNTENVLELFNKVELELIESKQLITILVFVIWYRLYFCEDFYMLYNNYNNLNNLNIQNAVYTV